MLSKRSLVLGVLSSALLGARARASFELDQRFEPQSVRFSGYSSGGIVVDPSVHFLYLQTSRTAARRYGVGVGKARLAFRGPATIGRKAKWPSWGPTQNMIRREPAKYARHAKGVPSGPGNPLGSRTLYLYRNGNDTLCRIHGTTQPSSIGRSVSNGCIRLINTHVEDLNERAGIGVDVVVR